MRGFVAFGIEPEFSARLQTAAAGFAADPALSLLHSADYHVTIKFLSEFSSTIFFETLEALSALGPPPRQSLTAGKIRLWPTVLVLEATPSEELRAWHREVNALLERRGFIQERHPLFRPHITLGRRKPGREIQVWAVPEDSFAGENIPVTAPMLWRSQSLETGRRHQELLSILFRAK